MKLMLNAPAALILVFGFAVAPVAAGPLEDAQTSKGARTPELMSDSPAAPCLMMKHGPEWRRCLINAAREIARNRREIDVAREYYSLYCSRPDEIKTAVSCLPLAIADHDCGLLPQNLAGMRDPELVSICRDALEQK